MYDELIKRLRDCTAEQNGEKTLWCQAADAIEELQKAVNFHKFNSEFWEDKYNSLADDMYERHYDFHQARSEYS